MLWIITEDQINDTGYAVGICSDDLAASLDALRVPEHRMAELSADCETEFRLLDDDDIVYYVGVCKDLANQPGDDAFSPMDFFHNTCGVTAMEYRAKGSNDAWVAL